jgi:hypothetical protein
LNEKNERYFVVRPCGLLLFLRLRKS